MTNMFNAKVTFVRAARTKAGAGWTETLSTLYSNVKCRIQLTSGMESITYNKKTYKLEGKLYCLPLTGLNEQDLIYYNSKFYEIIHVNNVDFAGRFLTIHFKNKE